TTWPVAPRPLPSITVPSARTRSAVGGSLVQGAGAWSVIGLLLSGDVAHMAQAGAQHKRGRAVIETDRGRCRLFGRPQPRAAEQPVLLQHRIGQRGEQRVDLLQVPDRVEMQ